MLIVFVSSINKNDWLRCAGLIIYNLGKTLRFYLMTHETLDQFSVKLNEFFKLVDIDS